MSKISFTTIERLEIAIRIYKSDMEIHQLDRDFPEPTLKVNPEDVIKLVADYRGLKELLRETLAELSTVLNEK